MESVVDLFEETGKWFARYRLRARSEGGIPLLISQVLRNEPSLREQALRSFPLTTRVAGFFRMRREFLRGFEVHTCPLGISFLVDASR